VQKNIYTNVVAPIALSRMTQTVMPEQLLNALKPEFISPLVLYLCHESCTENGSIFEVGGGWISKIRWERTKGGLFPINKKILPEEVKQKWDQITDFSQPQYPNSNQEAFGIVMNHLSSLENSKNTTQKTCPKPTDEVSSIFNIINQKVRSQGSNLVKEINGVYLFNIDDHSWTVDLKNGNGSVSNSATTKPDLTITIEKEDFIKAFTGKVTLQSIFQKKNSKLKFSGNMSLAPKLDLIVKQLSKL